MTATRPAAGLRVLLLGGHGFIGSNLARRLRGLGHTVIAVGRAGRDGEPALPLSAVEVLEQFVVGRGIDTVVHLVSGLLPGSNENDFMAEREAVVGPTGRLAARLADRGVPLVFLSSGGTVYGIPPHPTAAEDDPCRPISFYGQSKLEIELYLQFLERTRGLRCLIIRPSNPFGPGQALGGTQGLISVLLDRIRSGRALQVWGDGGSVRDYIYIDDMVDALAGLLERGTSGTTLNIGSGAGHSLLDVVRAVEEASGRSIPLEFQPARPVDVPRLVLDVSRLAAMGLHRTRPLAEGIRAYLGELEGRLEDRAPDQHP